jgi:hypothetical protein
MFRHGTLDTCALVGMLANKQQTTAAENANGIYNSCSELEIQEIDVKHKPSSEIQNIFKYLVYKYFCTWNK